MNTYPPVLQDRIRKPKNRGQLTKVDSAESQLGLLQAGNVEGTIYLLVNPKTSVIERAKFLSYGKLSSILIFDVFCENAKGKSLEAYDKIEINPLKDLLLYSIESDVLPFPEHDFETLNHLLNKVRTDLPEMEVVEPTAGKTGVYKRKAKEDMNQQDLAWLPLSAPQKIAKVEELIQQVVPERTSYLAEDVKLFDIKRDLKVLISFKPKIETQHKALIKQHISESCQASLHSEIVISEANS